ncbi:hypothetical protein FRC09_001109 [Ceratobasidium sp. 395]|nr:hypothetical protein FRC09_001109 [Ceratobasidium sp. 395]
MTSTTPETMRVDITYLNRMLTVTDIVSLIARSAPDHRPRTTITRSFTRDKQDLLEILLTDDQYWAEELYKIAVEKEEEQRRSRRERWRKRGENVRDTQRRASEEDQLQGDFLDLPSPEDLLKCYAEVYDATSNAALEQRVCAVCACRRAVLEVGFVQIRAPELPNRHRLTPHIPHPAHVLTQGCLLELKGCHDVEQNPSDPQADVCHECLHDLNGSKDLPPKHSLANNLWIGEIPWQLQCLTLAEQLLVARVFPRVLLIKLYPRGRSQRNMPADQVQTGLRGNVTSFELNSAAIADMIAGKYMPQQCDILASILSVTFIGRAKIRDPDTLHMLRVRRGPVGDALKWLKENNPKYYGDIIISQTRLDALPDDGIPDAIRVGIRYENNELMANDEYRGYVPGAYYAEHTATEGTIHFWFSGAYSPPRVDDDGINEEDDDDPDVIPLQYLGVMDNDLSKVSSDNFVEWGLENMQGRRGNFNCEYGYAVRYGAPANTFGQPPRGEPPPDPARSNYWEAALPPVYPFGVGGIESDRPVPLSFNDQSRWSLEYHDGRFRYHHSFIFLVFGIMQK